MTKYGECAIESVEFCIKQKISPVVAWDEKTSRKFGKGSSSQKKGCPRTTFLGLCEEGHVKGIPKGKYLQKDIEVGNKAYAIKAVELLRQNPELINNKSALWSLMTNDKSITQNGQVGVISALWKRNIF